MNIEYIHASKYGNGKKAAEEFKRQMATNGVAVSVHDVREVDPGAPERADLYLFSSPGRFGRPRPMMRRFLKQLRLPAGTRYALLATEMAPSPRPKSGLLPGEAVNPPRQRILPVMNEILGSKGLVEVGEESLTVLGMKGPLADGWQERLRTFSERLARSAAA